MKIAILNECFLNEEYLERLRNFGEVVESYGTSTAEIWYSVQ